MELPHGLGVLHHGLRRPGARLGGAESWLSKVSTQSITLNHLFLELPLDLDISAFLQGEDESSIANDGPRRQPLQQALGTRLPFGHRQDGVSSHLFGSRHHGTTRGQGGCRGYIRPGGATGSMGPLLWIPGGWPVKSRLCL